MLLKAMRNLENVANAAGGDGGANPQNGGVRDLLKRVQMKGAAEGDEEKYGGTAITSVEKVRSNGPSPLDRQLAPPSSTRPSNPGKKNLQHKPDPPHKW
eukprot:616541-Prorocentrum_minimum.AAC.2